MRGGGADGSVAVISYAMWQRRYGGAPDVIGTSVSIERAPFTIIGVTPKGFFGPDVGRSFDIAVPLGTEPVIRRDATVLDERSAWWMNIMARLKPGQTAEQATALVRSIQPHPRGDDAGVRSGRPRQLPDRSVHPRAGGRRTLGLARALRTAALRHPRRRRARAADRVRQRREPAHASRIDPMRVLRNP